MVCMKIPMKQKQCWPSTQLNYLFLSSNSYSPIFILEICNNVGFAQHDRSFLNETDWVLQILDLFQFFFLNDENEENENYHRPWKSK